MALWLADAPTEMLVILDEVITKVVKERFDHYSRIVDEIHVRIMDLPAVETIRDLRHHHVNKLVRLSGVVTKRSAMMPQIKYVTYSCARCSNLMGPFYQMGNEEPKLSRCASCDSKGPFIVKSEQTSYRDYQKITLQEAPGTVPPGRLPRSKDVVLLLDLVDTVRPGEAIEVTGIYKNVLDIALNANNGFPLFATVIEANHISKREDAFASYKLSQEDKQAIIDLSRDPRVGRKVMKSIAPSIYGHDNIKKAIALSLFGGVAKDIQGKHRLRGDINILLLGDPVHLFNFQCSQSCAGNGKVAVFKVCGEDGEPCCVHHGTRCVGRGFDGVGAKVADHARVDVGGRRFGVGRQGCLPH